MEVKKQQLGFIRGSQGSLRRNVYQSKQAATGVNSQRMHTLIQSYRLLSLQLLMLKSLTATEKSYNFSSNNCNITMRQKGSMKFHLLSSPPFKKFKAQSLTASEDFGPIESISWTKVNYFWRQRKIGAPNYSD